MQILVTKSGGVEMLHDDTAELESLGTVTTTRASHVEFCNERQQWYVQSAKTKKMLKYFDTRQQALAWERDYYSPSGQGWQELHQQTKGKL